jgi:uncharacterized protein YbjT (DUF2867 family)
MSHHEIAAAMSEVLGRKVRYVPISVDEFEAILRRRGEPEFVIQHLRSVAIDYRNGVFSGTNDVIERIGRAAPLDVAGFVAQHKEFYNSYGKA